MISKRLVTKLEDDGNFVYSNRVNIADLIKEYEEILESEISEESKEVTVIDVENILNHMSIVWDHLENKNLMDIFSDMINANFHHTEGLSSEMSLNFWEESIECLQEIAEVLGFEYIEFHNGEEEVVLHVEDDLR